MKTNHLSSFFTFLVLFFSCFLSGQNNSCNCLIDLVDLDKRIRKVPAYKINKNEYDKAFILASEAAKVVNTDYDCFVLLNRLTLALNDNHTKVYGLNEGASKEDTVSDDAIVRFKMSEQGKAYPIVSMNLDSLTKILKLKSMKEVEGIYYRKGFMTLAVYKDNLNENFKAVILDTELPLYSKGELMYTFIPYGTNLLLGVGSSFYSKRFISYTERIVDGYFLTMRFQKNPELPNYSVAPLPDSMYIRKELSPSISYLKVGSFSSWYPALGVAEKFYKKLDGSLSKQNIIIDLRDNGGGGDRNSDILLKIFKNMPKSTKFYVIINNRTASNAEQFALKLKNNFGATIAGNASNGTAAYEIKNSTYNLSCDKFVAVLTSKVHKEYLPLESKGLTPDFPLAIDQDWIEQVLAIIERD